MRRPPSSPARSSRTAGGTTGRSTNDRWPVFGKTGGGYLSRQAGPSPKRIRRPTRPEESMTGLARRVSWTCSCDLVRHPGQRRSIRFRVGRCSSSRETFLQQQSRGAGMRSSNLSGKDDERRRRVACHHSAPARTSWIVKRSRGVRSRSPAAAVPRPGYIGRWYTQFSRHVMSLTVSPTALLQEMLLP